MLYVASVDEVVTKVPKNIFLFLKASNLSSDCFIESIVREYFDYNIFIYLDPTLTKEKIDKKGKHLGSLVSAYNNVFIKEDKFDFDNFLKTNFSRHSKLTQNFVTQFKSQVLSDGANQHVDKQLVPFLDLWLNGGYYFSVNVTFDNIKKTHNLNELYNFYCDEIIIDEKQNEKHKNCKINFLKVHQLDCVVELAIKNYLLYYEKHKSYNFNHMFMNLYSNQNRILSKKGHNQYLTCFRNKLKVSQKKGNSIDYLFKFTNHIEPSYSAISEETCPIIYSMKDNKPTVQ